MDVWAIHLANRKYNIAPNWSGMEIGTETLVGGATLLFIQIGLLIANYFRQRQSKRDAEIERERKDDEMRQILTNALIGINDKTAKSLENLRSKMEENEAKYRDDLKVIEQRHKQERQGDLQTIRTLETELKEQLDAAARDREYYRKTINDIRDDSRKLMEIASDAQKEAERSQLEKEKLSQDNNSLAVTVTGQREQIIQLTTRLEHLQEERNQLQRDLEILQATQQENEQLRAEILALKEQIRLKDVEILRLNLEIETLKRGNINPVITSASNHVGQLTSAGVAGELAKSKPEGNEPR